MQNNLILEIISAVANVATAAGVLLAVYELLRSRRQAVTEFEDALSSEYRQIALALPVKSLLGEALSYKDQRATLEHFYHYFDLCNQQVFLRHQKRVSKETWVLWCDGIRSI